MASDPCFGGRERGEEKREEERENIHSTEFRLTKFSISRNCCWVAAISLSSFVWTELQTPEVKNFAAEVTATPAAMMIMMMMMSKVLRVCNFVGGTGPIITGTGRSILRVRFLDEQGVALRRTF